MHKGDNYQQINYSRHENLFMTTVIVEKTDEDLEGLTPPLGRADTQITRFTRMFSSTHEYFPQNSEVLHRITMPVRVGLSFNCYHFIFSPNIFKYIFIQLRCHDGFFGANQITGLHMEYKTRLKGLYNIFQGIAKLPEKNFDKFLLYKIWGLRLFSQV